LAYCRASTGSIIWVSRPEAGKERTKQTQVAWVFKGAGLPKGILDTLLYVGKAGMVSGGEKSKISSTKKE